MLRPGGPGNDERVEILICLDTVDPPAGRLRVVPGPGAAPRRGQDEGLRFTGWLGLLRVLYEVTGSPAVGPPGHP